LVENFLRGDLDLLQPVIRMESNRHLGLFGEPFMRIPFALLTVDGRTEIKDIAELNGESVAIPSGWAVLEFVRNRFPDIRVVEAENTLDAIRKALGGEVTAAIDNEIILRYVARHYFLKDYQVHPEIAFGEADPPDELHIVVPDSQPQLRALLDKAIAALGDEQHRYLADKWLDFDNDQQELASSTVPSEVFVTIAGDAALHGQLVNADINGEPHLVYGAPTVTADEDHLFLGISTPVAVVMAPYIKQVSLSILITGVFMLLLLPLSWFFANPIVRPIRQLALENDKVRRREYDDVEKVASYVKELDELSDSMVSMVTSIQAYEAAQRQLMDAIIKLIAQAIDDKSAYTGGHCERVPQLAMMLAQHASDSQLPAFRNFSLSNEEQWREYRIAAWLHDCGKITTPEHIVDKGSKLETIYNRIHEVRMRFEVLWRDAEIQYLRDAADNPERQQEMAARLDSRRRQLEDDFAFVAECNVGGEYLDEDKLNRLREIAETTWQRHFDDRIGLSPVEELRVPPGSATLPATEKLLADKPEHIIERTRSTDYPPEFGINMDIPEHLYNLGEVYNLSISRGTLTDEDRFKINEHMISTIKMLESLPFPEELSNVPRYASTHHETMKGSGYPRKLPGSELSIPERLLAVADVFEALTASDRPYKKAKPVSVAIDILHKMVLDNHIDRDCFELFIRDRVYEEYAHRFLPPEQLDDFDASSYLGSSAKQDVA
jgi:HD-GYP domain-containing protein (c-di-GMP phosphodiesterase class II)